MRKPRQVGASELRRMKKSGKVRKKLGAQPAKEKPVSVAPKDEGMSGSASAEPPAPAPIPQPEKLAVQEQPMASMSASMEYRDTLLETLIQNNTAAIQGFRQALLEQKPQPGKAYRHKVIRDKKSSLIDEVISTPMES